MGKVVTPNNLQCTKGWLFSLYLHSPHPLFSCALKLPQNLTDFGWKVTHWKMHAQKSSRIETAFSSLALRVNTSCIRKKAKLNIEKEVGKQKSYHVGNMFSTKNMLLLADLHNKYTRQFSSSCLSFSNGFSRQHCCKNALK